MHWLYTSEELLRVDDENWINNVHAWLNFIIKNRTYSSDKIGIGVHKEIRNGKVCVVYYAKVSEKYIDSSSRQFKNTGNPIVFNTACQSLKNNDNMAEAFKRKGAGCYLGYTETNDIGHNGGEYFYANMLNAQCIGKAKESIPNDWQKETWINNKNEKISVELKKILLNDKADNICIIDPETLEAEIESDNGNESVTLKGQIKMLLPSLLDRYEMGFVLADNKEMNDTLHKPVSGDYDETARLMRFEKTLENSDLRSGKNYYQAYMYDGTSYCYGEIKSFTTKGDAEPYYVWDEVSKTATFYYDGMCDRRGGKDRNYTSYHVPYNAIRVVFDHSFALFHPKGFTFWDCSNLKQIDNIKYLNTDSITNMTFMFRGCSSLTNLDLTSFNTTNVTGMGMDYMFDGCRSLTSLDLSSFNTKNVTSMRAMFYGCSSLTNLDLTSFNTTNVTSMCEMFYGCSSLMSLDLSSFNTTNVTGIGMANMFSGCSSLTGLDLTSFNTTNVTSMRAMFYGCSSLTSLDLTSFNTTNVTSMRAMFYGCSSLTSLDLTSFNTTSVTDMGMRAMFYECSSLTSLDLTGFNTTNVTSMDGMFFGCSSLTILDLTSFNTTNVTETKHMFNGCSSLKTIFAGNWACNDSDFAMFLSCSNLVGGKGTKIGQNLYGYDEDGNPLYYYCDGSSDAAHIDGGKDNPGLFTAK